MPVLKIVGYETGKKKFELQELLVARLGLEGEEADKIREAVMSSTGITLNFEDEEYAVGLGQELVEAGAKVEMNT